MSHQSTCYLDCIRCRVSFALYFFFFFSLCKNVLEDYLYLPKERKKKSQRKIKQKKKYWSLISITFSNEIHPLVLVFDIMDAILFFFSFFFQGLLCIWCWLIKIYFLVYDWQMMGLAPNFQFLHLVHTCIHR